VIDGMKARISLRSLLFAAFGALVLTTGAVTAGTADLFVTDGGLGKVLRYTPDGVRRVFADVLSAEGLAFDTSGNLYVTDFNESFIIEFGRNGKVRRIASGVAVSNPSALAFDSSGNLFVAHNGTGPGIAKVAPDGTLTSFVSHLEPTGLAFNSEGNLFATDYLSNTVLKYTPDGTGTTFATGFGQPAGLAFDSAGNLFVSDLVSGIIYKITPDGTKSTFVDGLRQPLGLAFDADGNLFVCDAGAILMIAPEGTISTFSERHLISPINLAFQP
jgi:sugar lactone lactonase YvrE